MQTSLTDDIRNTPEGREAEAILRSCVHCGFCTATCPTYQLLGDELDGPRGRIYLIKQLLEGQPVSRHSQLHLDRCLTCRACETTCPSGVRYARLADIGRAALERRVPRPLPERALRRALRATIPHPGRFGILLRLAQLLRAALPQALARKIPARQRPAPWPRTPHARTLLLLESCGQAAATPNTNAAAARVLDRLGIALQRVPGTGCCGALSLHLGAEAEARAYACANIDRWWPQLEAGAEAVVSTASGCGVMLKDYGELLRDDPAYADKARQVAARVRDLSEVLGELDRSALHDLGRGRRVAFHAPCTLQHGLRLAGAAERILREAGYRLTPVADAHLCCGSAGTYSMLQPRLARRLRDNKLAALQQGGPELIATANIGCQLHLQTGAPVPVKHWIELLDSPSTG